MFKNKIEHIISWFYKYVTICKMLNTRILKYSMKNVKCVVHILLSSWFLNALASLEALDMNDCLNMKTPLLKIRLNSFKY